MQAPPAYLSAAPYVGSGPPSSMYIGVPPYGSSVFNGTSVPPYDVPFSGGSAYHYNSYGSRFSGGSPYRPLHISAPPPYSSGSIMRSGIFIFYYWCVFFLHAHYIIYLLLPCRWNVWFATNYRSVWNWIPYEPHHGKVAKLKVGSSYKWYMMQHPFLFLAFIL